MSGYGAANLSTLILLAWVLIVAAAVATVACLVAARASGLHGRRRYRWAGLAAGVIVAGVLPPILGSGDAQTSGVTSQGAYALLYSLPWGAAIAASGWLNRSGAITALATVAVSAASAELSHDVLWVAHPTRGFVPVVVLVIALAIAAPTRSAWPWNSAPERPV